LNKQKDHYKTLGVSETASGDEIKKAFRRLAKKFHPDATGGDKAKEARFKEINEAYETVGDEKKRTQYDAERKNPFGGFGGFPPGAGPFRPGQARQVNIDLNDIFDRGGRGGGGGGFADIFSDFFSGGGVGTATRPSARGPDITSRLEIDLPTAALGGDVGISVEGKKLTVKVPPGVEEGQTIRVAGRGAPGPKGAGDLLLEVHVRPHPQLRRVGRDLEVDMQLSIDVAVLGGKADVTTLEGHVQVTVPAGTSSGTRLRLRGKGVPHRDGTRGDLYAVAQIVVPREIPQRARELIAEFAKLTKK
jgi:DnaJ-class molecular chaperone